MLWTPTTDLGGATVALGAAIPFGRPDVTVSAVISGPFGQVGVRRTDDAFVVGDPILLGMVGVRQGDLHVQASTMINVPVGDYREGKLANLAFHRWAVDFSLAATWHDEASGWDVSGKAGVTFNGENEETDYNSGTELHFEASLERTFSKAWSAGLQAYHLTQVTGDAGAGARLGDFRGEVTGVGANVSYRFQLGRAPIALRFRAFSEFDAVNRLDVITGRAPIKIDYAPGSVHLVEQHDGTRLALRKLGADYDVHDRLAAQAFLAKHTAKGQVVTGLLYVEPEAEDLHAHLNTVETPLNRLEADQLCPGQAALDKINASLR